MKLLGIFLTLRYFLITVIIFLALTLVVVLLFPKTETHLFINKFYAKWSDLFFKYYTHVGDGAFSLILLPYFLFFGKLRNLLIAIMACLLAGILAQFFKRAVFADLVRPSGLFQEGILHIVNDVKLCHSYSFPSGHSASSFAFFSVLAFLFCRNKIAQVGFAIMAILAGFSRVYLSQHFLMDILAGGIIGVLSFILAYKIVLLLKTHYTHELCVYDCVRTHFQNRFSQLKS